MSEPWLKAPQRPIARNRWGSADHRRITAELGDHPHLRLHPVVMAMGHQRTMNAVGGAGGATGEVGGVDVERIQRADLTTAISFRG